MQTVDTRVTQVTQAETGRRSPANSAAVATIVELTAAPDHAAALDADTVAIPIVLRSQRRSAMTSWSSFTCTVSRCLQYT